MTGEFVAGVRAHFAQYEPTISLVDGLIASNAHAQEILILVCSRLDALANSAGRPEMSQHRKFAAFVTHYGGSSRFFGSVSIGDLYYELGYHRWILPGLMPMAGRLQMFSDVNREVAVLLEDSGIELTQKAADRLLAKLQRCVASHFQARPQRTPRKRVAVPSTVLTEALLRNVRGLPAEVMARLSRAIQPLLLRQTCASILYRRFRSEAIHGGRVLLDESQFFTEQQPYWKSLHSEHYGSFLLLEFPALFLRQLLANCLRTYERHILARGKVPPDIHFEMFPDDVFRHLDWLDYELLPRVESVRLAIPGR
jgi:hypothetical protein